MTPNEFEEEVKWFNNFILQAFKEWVSKDKKIGTDYLFNTSFYGKLTAQQILEQMEERRDFGLELQLVIKLKLIAPSSGFSNTKDEEQGKRIASMVIEEVMGRLEFFTVFN